MKSIETLMDDLRASVRTADFNRIAGLTDQIVAALDGWDREQDPAKLRNLRAKAEINAALLSAALRGVRAARRRVEETRRVAVGLQTYDSKGRRSNAASASPTTGRF
jgi:hypothetical protein